MNHTKTALDLFSRHYHCSQSVFGAFADDLGLPQKQALQIGACFGGGMRKGEVCGACTGALMVLGMQYDRSDPAGSGNHEQADALGTAFLERFRRENGSYLCRELLGCDLADPAGSASAREQGLFTTRCPLFVASAVRITEELIAENGFPHIRPAQPEDASRIAEIIIANYRMQFYPVFRSDEFYFRELNLAEQAERLRTDAGLLAQYFVFDDGIVRGCIRISGTEIVRLFVEPAFQGRGIGAGLLTFAETVHRADHLWVLECNPDAIRFYARHGWRLTDTKKPEEGTDKNLILMQRECD